MSRRYRRNRRKKQVVRSKVDCPTKKAAMRSLEKAGIMPHMIAAADHTGTYWRWTLRSA